VFIQYFWTRVRAPFIGVAFAVDDCHHFSIGGGFCHRADGEFYQVHAPLDDDTVAGHLFVDVM